MIWRDRIYLQHCYLTLEIPLLHLHSLQLKQGSEISEGRRRIKETTPARSYFFTEMILGSSEWKSLNFKVDDLKHRYATRLENTLCLNLKGYLSFKVCDLLVGITIAFVFLVLKVKMADVDSFSTALIMRVADSSFLRSSSFSAWSLSIFPILVRILLTACDAEKWTCWMSSVLLSCSSLCT